MSLQIKGQGTTYGFSFNIMALQGEISQGALISDDIGLGIGLTADVPLINPRFEFSWKADYQSLRMDYIGKGANVSFAEITASQYRATGGLNIHLLSNHNMANIYQPFRPYAFVYGGLLYQNNSIEESDNNPFSVVNGGFVAPLAELGLGIKIRVNPNWSFNIQGSLGTSFDDDIDGLLGSSSLPDIMGTLRFGMQSRFR